MLQDQPVSVMGILNVTPDSFSDGGQWSNAQLAISQCKQLLTSGADVVDIGAESTKPGSHYVDAETEWARLEPVLKGISAAGANLDKISIDTRRDNIVLRCLSLGYSKFNNVEGLYQRSTLEAINEASGTVCAMHMQGKPNNMQHNPLDQHNVAAEVSEFFESSATVLGSVGFSDDRFLLDPGVGFGKSLAANLRLIDSASTWSKKYPLLYGVSRKSFIGSLFGIKRPQDRDAPTKIIEKALANAGVKMIRTHNVAAWSQLQHCDARTCS